VLPAIGMTALPGTKKERGQVRRCVYGGRMPRAAQAVPTGTVATNKIPNLEPSAVAMIIAGIPIATVASAMARASIMSIPLV